jgi:hypothetical protein
MRGLASDSRYIDWRYVKERTPYLKVAVNSTYREIVDFTNGAQCVEG